MHRCKDTAQGAFFKPANRSPIQRTFSRKPHAAKLYECVWYANRSRYHSRLPGGRSYYAADDQSRLRHFHSSSPKYRGKKLSTGKERGPCGHGRHGGCCNDPYGSCSPKWRHPGLHIWSILVTEKSATIDKTFFSIIAPFYIVFGITTSIRSFLEGVGDMVYTGIISIAALGVRNLLTYSLVRTIWKQHYCPCGRLVMGSLDLAVL